MKNARKNGQFQPEFQTLESTVIGSEGQEK